MGNRNSLQEQDKTGDRDRRRSGRRPGPWIVCGLSVVVAAAVVMAMTHAPAVAYDLLLVVVAVMSSIEQPRGGPSGIARR